MAGATGVRRYLQPREVDLAVESAIRQLPEQLPKLDRQPGRKCRVCFSPESRALVNKMLAHLMSYADILEVCELSINPARAKNRKVTYRSVLAHAHNHFNLDNPAGAQYRQMMENRADEIRRQEGVTGLNNLLNAFGFLDVVAHKGYETLIKDETYVSVGMGMEAILKLDAMTRKAASQHTEVELRQQLAVIQNAVKDIVPPEYWDAIIERIEDGETRVTNGAIDAEVIDDYDDYGDDDTPYSPPIEADVDDTLET